MYSYYYFEQANVRDASRKHSLTMSKFFSLISKSVLLLICSGSVLAQSVQLIGVMPGMAVLKVDGSSPKTVKVGQSYNDVKVLSVAGSSAMIEVAGKRQKLDLGDAGFSSDSQSGSGNVSQVLTADQQGHFFTTIAINGRSTSAVVDTGATAVSMGEGVAAQLGLDYKSGQRVIVNTANGQANSWMVRLDSVRVGNITLYQVDGTVIQGNMPMVLLGMSFLNRLEMKRNNGQLELIKH